MKHVLMRPVFIFRVGNNSNFRCEKFFALARFVMVKEVIEHLLFGYLQHLMEKICHGGQKRVRDCRMKIFAV